MTQKEKFEEAKRLYETANADQRYVLESLFPELRESEDERIRKALIKFFTLSDDNADYQCCGVHYKDIVAWLERQEQKSAWSEKYIADVFEKVGLAKIVREQSNDNLTNALQDAMIELSKFIPRPKQEWSEEDNRMCKAVIDNIKAICKEGYFVGDIGSDKLINWLKYLRSKNRYVYNPYKAVVESIAEMCKHYDKASHSGLRDFYDNIKVKCKDAKEYDSLYPQSQWKPSAEQMDALLYVVRNYTPGVTERIAWESIKTLELMFKDLKKLKD